MTAHNLLLHERSRQEQAKQLRFRKLFHIGRPVTVLSVALLAATAVMGSTINTMSYLDSISAGLPVLTTHRVTARRSVNTQTLALGSSVSSDSAGRVLGATVLAPAPSTEAQISVAAMTSTIASVVNNQLNQYLSQGLLTGPAGPSGASGLTPGFSGPNGMVQNGNGQTTSVIGGTPIVSYIPASQGYGNYTGGSLAGFNNLSAGTFASGNTTISGNLNVSGPVSASSLTSSGDATIAGALSAATSTLSTLTVSGPATFNGSTTIAGLTVIGLNPGLTQGSIAIQGTSGLSQDNANLFYDATNHRLGLGTTTPSQLLTVAGNAVFTGNVGIGTTTPGSPLTVYGPGGTSLSGFTNVMGEFISTANSRGRLLIESTNTASAGRSDELLFDAQNTAGTAMEHKWAIGNDLNFDGTNNLYFYDNKTGNNHGALRMIMDQYGNLGISTSTPSARLSIVGASSSNIPFGQYAADPFDIASTSGASLFHVNSSGAVAFAGQYGAPNQILMSNGSSSTPLWAATSTLGFAAASSFSGTNGYVARWTSGSALATGLLMDNGAVSGVNATSSGYTFNIQSSGGVAPLNVSSSSGTSLLTVLGNGNVGIGTTSPQAKLDINGTVNIGSSLSIGTTVVVPCGGINDLAAIQASVTNNLSTRLTGTMCLISGPIQMNVSGHTLTVDPSTTVKTQAGSLADGSAELLSVVGVNNITVEGGIWDGNKNNVRWGIYLTQVTPRCSMACRGGLSPKSGRIRGALFDGGSLPRVSGSAAVAGWFSVSAVWRAGDLAGARGAAAVWGLRIPELGDGWDNLPGHA